MMLPYLFIFIAFSFVECSPFKDGDHFSTVALDGDYLDVYCRKALGTIVISRNALCSLTPHDIYDSFQALSTLNHPDLNHSDLNHSDLKKRNVQILKSVMQQQWDAFEWKSLEKIRERFETHFKDQNHSMAIYLPPSYHELYFSKTPAELLPLESSNSRERAFAAWTNFSQYLSYASAELRKVYTTPISHTESSQVVETRLAQITDNTLLIWSVDHMHSWGNVMSTLHYAEYIRHLILALGDVHSSAVYWEGSKNISKAFQCGILLKDYRTSGRLYELKPVRYSNTKTLISLTASPGCKLVTEMQIVRLPTSGPPYLHFMVLEGTLFVYCSILPHDRKLILRHLKVTSIDHELQQQIIHSLRKK